MPKHISIEPHLSLTELEQRYRRKMVWKEAIIKLFQILTTFYQIFMVRRKPFKGVTQIFTMLRQIFIMLPNLLWCHSGDTLELLR